jgi:hypothetical protein
MSGTARQLGIGQPDPASALGAGPSLADAWQFNANAVGDYVAQKRAESEAMGLWANGGPTAKGAQRAAGQVATALVAGTRENPEGFNEAVHAWRRGELPSIYDAPAYKRYRADLDAKRQLWSAADYHRNVLKSIEQRAAEPNLTPEGRARIQRQLERAAGAYGGARAAAQFFGHDVEGEFPRDEWMRGEFPRAEGPPGGRLDIPGPPPFRMPPPDEPK